MSTKYSLKEIIRFAIEIEKDGSLFYEKIAAKTVKQEFKDLFLSLKKDEIFHKEKFEHILNNLGPDDNEYLFNLDNEYTAYLHSFIENRVFNNKEDINSLLKKLNSSEEIIKYALDREDDSINFYNNLKEVIDKDYLSTLDIIINEEYKHKEKLKSIKNSIII